MTEGESLLGITADNIRQTGLHFRTGGGDLFDPRLSFIFHGQKTIVRQQPKLGLYLGGVNNIVITNQLLFALGATLTYDMLPENLQKETLSDGEIRTAHRSIQERTFLQPVPGSDKTEVVTDFSWLQAKLDDDSPAFVKWLRKIENSQNQDNPYLYNDFLIGVLVTILPFYMRAEAQQLERKLYP